MASLLSDEGGLRAERENLTLHAPFTGIVTDLPSELRPGLWVKPDQPLARLVNPDRASFRAYLSGTDLDRVRIGARGRYLSEDPARPPLPVVVTDIEQVNASALDQAALASTQGGPIAVHPAGPNAASSALIPTSPVYRVTLAPVDPTPAPLQTVPGTVLLDADAASPFRRIWRATVGVLIRESGF
jgi:putative peptide zinc metalloprotease protein